MSVVYLGFGSNLGNRAENIRQALRELASLPTIKITTASSLYETAPVGITDQPDFLNAVAGVETTLAPEELLEAILAAEKKMGRVRTLRWGPRVIDIDILVYEDMVRVTPELSLPHLRLMERSFALVPLAEIAPDLIIPGQKLTAKKKAEQLLENPNILNAQDVIKLHGEDLRQKGREVFGEVRR